ncbi:MAG TPA: FAD-dependent oxidoreductase [Myxococcota bacterium]|nr:FAD-dependent oxidoreductase [Myxococcota bacterium]
MERHAVVVGAGPAGLAAALALRARGVRVTLLERAGAAGGRGRDEAVDGPAAAAPLVGAGDAALAALLERAGAAQPRPATFALWRGGKLEPLAPAGAVARVRAALARARLERIERRFAALLDRDAPERAARFDDRSAAAMARLYLPRAALAADVAPLTAGLGLGDAEEASRVPALLLRRSLAQPPRVLRGAVDALAAAATRDCELRFGGEVERVESAGARVRVRTASGATLECDAVVVATPADAARRLAEPLLTTPERDVLARTRYAPALALHAALERAPAPRATRVLVPAEAALPVAWLDLAPAGTHAPQSGGLATLVAGAEWSRAHLGAPDDAVAKELSSLLARLVPGSARELRLTRVVRHERAFPLFPVGRYRELARFRRVQSDRRALGRRLYFAGDYLAEPTLEGAVRSAVRAASGLASDLSVE